MPRVYIASLLVEGPSILRVLAVVDGGHSVESALGNPFSPWLFPNMQGVERIGFQRIVLLILILYFVLIVCCFLKWSLENERHGSHLKRHWLPCFTASVLDSDVAERHHRLGVRFDLDYLAALWLLLDERSWRLSYIRIRDWARFSDLKRQRYLLRLVVYILQLGRESWLVRLLPFYVLLRLELCHRRGTLNKLNLGKLLRVHIILLFV